MERWLSFRCYPQTSPTLLQVVWPRLARDQSLPRPGPDNPVRDDGRGTVKCRLHTTAAEPDLHLSLMEGRPMMPGTFVVLCTYNTATTTKAHFLPYLSCYNIHSPVSVLILNSFTSHRRHGHHHHHKHGRYPTKRARGSEVKVKQSSSISKVSIRLSSPPSGVF
ncbi:hypothetical protein VTK56DRAFT_4276 [Thermocarpiscus australiensis]